MISAPIKDVENEDSLRFFINKEGRHGFFFERDNPQIVHHVIFLLPSQGRDFQLLAFMTKFFKENPRFLRVAAFVCYIAI